MNSLLATIAPILLMLPGAVAVTDVRDGAMPAAGASAGTPGAELTVPRGPMSLPGGEEQAPWQAMLSVMQDQIQHQVRIEQTLVIRVAPRAASAPPVLLAELPQNGTSARLQERRMGRCVPMAGIAGVQYGGDRRLILFMRDQRMIAATLESACRARDFYSGFYVARNGDGMMCVDRDQLQSRSGANCQIDGFRQLIEADE